MVPRSCILSTTSNYSFHYFLHVFISLHSLHLICRISFTSLDLFAPSCALFSLCSQVRLTPSLNFSSHSSCFFCASFYLALTWCSLLFPFVRVTLISRLVYFSLFPFVRLVFLSLRLPLSLSGGIPFPLLSLSLSLSLFSLPIYDLCFLIPLWLL